jgi:hypothetical protein
VIQVTAICDHDWKIVGNADIISNTVLQAEFPLLDEPLIRAILSDHPAEQLISHMDQIREDLDLLQASVVPDPDAAVYQNDSISESTSQTSWLPFGVEQGSHADEASSKTTFAELKDEDKEPQQKLATIAGPSCTPISQPRNNTLDEEGRPQSSMSMSDHEELDEDSSTDIERWLEKSEDYGPLDFLYDMFSHL